MGIKGKNKPKIIVLLGPTASGKSNLAVSLALKFFGEVVSADSRQVYRGMDIGTGKITKKEKKGVPHYLLNVASPKRRFTAFRYKKEAEKAIKKIIKRGKIPIVCGGTAFYIKILTEGSFFPDISPDWSFRKKLEKKTKDDLFAIIKKKDPQRAKNIDKNNRRRLVRAVEIIEKTKKTIPKIKKKPRFYPLFLGIKKDREILNKRIEQRLKKRLEEGMVKEVKKLKTSGISWKRLESFGLEYKWVALYLQKKINYEDMKKKLFFDIKKFSKKQLVWWKHDKRIKWIKTKKEAELLVKNFLNT